jgi:hypothetical protein
VVDTLTNKAGMADRTNFRPETTSPERNERDQSPTKIQQNHEAGLYPPAHNGLLAGSLPAVPVKGPPDLASNHPLQPCRSAAAS